MPRGSKKCAGKTLHQGPKGGLYCIVDGKKYYVAAVSGGTAGPAKPARRATPVAAAPAAPAAAKAKKPTRPKTPTPAEPKKKPAAGKKPASTEGLIMDFFRGNLEKTGLMARWTLDDEGMLEGPPTTGNVLKKEKDHYRLSARKVYDLFPDMNHFFTNYTVTGDAEYQFFMGIRTNGSPYWIPYHGKWQNMDGLMSMMLQSKRPPTVDRKVF